VREFTVRDVEWNDLMSTGSLTCVGLRPQRISAAEPYCHKCDQVAWPIRTRGPWDEERQATAITDEVVWVLMSCGCTFGDDSLAEPSTPAHQPHDAARAESEGGRGDE
jgi:hypothetical protein